MTTYAFHPLLSENEWAIVEDALRYYAGLDGVKQKPDPEDTNRIKQIRAAYVQQIIDKVYDNIEQMSGIY